MQPLGHPPTQAAPLAPLALMCGIALVVRVAAMVTLQSWEFADEWTYGYEMGQMGRWLAEGHGFTLNGTSPTAFVAPAYPVVVGAAFAVFGVYSKAAAIALFLFQSLCAVGTAICLVALGSRLFNRAVGLIAGFVWAVYPTSIWYSVDRIWSSELALLLLLLTITIAVSASSPLSYYRVACLGGLSGLTVLADSKLIIYLVVLLLWMLYTRFDTLSKWIVAILVWASVGGIMVSPWVMRNWFVLGFPRLVKSNFGQVLFRGNRPLSSDTGAGSVAFDEQLATLDPKELAYYQNQSELVYNRYLMRKALEWIQGHPSQFLTLTVKRIWYFWGRIPKRVGGRNSWVHTAYYGPVVVLAIVGLWYGCRRHWHMAPIWLFFMVYPLPFYLTLVWVYRYRYPVEPLLVLLAAIPLAIWALPQVHGRVSSIIDPPSQPVASSRRR